MIVHSGITQLEASVELETNPIFSPWAWYGGALQQYHTALLLLLIMLFEPNQKEAERIWRCLDFIFECNADLPREQKCRMIISDLRDKMSLYRDARKVRAPTGMQQVQMASRKKGGSRESSLVSPSEYSSPSDGFPESQSNSAVSGEAMFGQMPSFQYQDNGSDTSSSQGGAFMPMPPADDLVTDIDWVRDASLT